MDKDKTDKELARLVYNLKLMNREQLAVCVGILKSPEGLTKPLGKIIVEQGFLNLEMVSCLMAKVANLPLVCSKCRAANNAGQFNRLEEFVCRNCGEVLLVGREEKCALPIDTSQKDSQSSKLAKSVPPPKTTETKFISPMHIFIKEIRNQGWMEDELLKNIMTPVLEKGGGLPLLKQEIIRGNYLSQEKLAILDSRVQEFFPLPSEAAKEVQGDESKSSINTLKPQESKKKSKQKHTGLRGFICPTCKMIIDPNMVEKKRQCFGCGASLESAKMEELANSKTEASIREKNKKTRKEGKVTNDKECKDCGAKCYIHISKVTFSEALITGCASAIAVGIFSAVLALIHPGFAAGVFIAVLIPFKALVCIGQEKRSLRCSLCGWQEVLSDPWEEWQKS